MKIIHATTMFLALLGMFWVTMLGIGYEVEGHGLHPMLAGALFSALGIAGFFASTLLRDE